MNYGIRKEVNTDFETTIRNLKEKLKEEGFGVLTEIDVQDTLRKKLDERIDNYAIIGACNPLFAHQALLSEKEIGLLLPCNIIVYEDKKKIIVSAIKPTTAMKIINNPNIKVIAKEVERKLAKVIAEV